LTISFFGLIIIYLEFLAQYTYQLRMTIHLSSSSSDIDLSNIESIAKSEKLKKFRR